MSAYYGDEKFKQAFVARAESMLEGDAAILSLNTGIPIELIEAAKGLAQALPAETAQAWPAAFADAIHLDADLDKASYSLMEWLIADTRYGLLGLARRSRTKAMLRLLGAYFSKIALHAGQSGQVQPGGELILAFAFLKREVALWKNWKNGGLDDWRASRAALEIWKAREMRPKDLARSLMAVRAAYGDRPETARAQALALRAVASLERLETHLAVYSKAVNG